MKTKIWAILLVTLVVSLPAVAFAASPWMSETTYSDKMTGKLGFGLTNTILGWTDLFAEPNRYHNEGRNVMAGVGKGLVDTVHNTVGGAIHTGTFMIPVDFPLPENGVDLSGMKSGKQEPTQAAPASLNEAERG